MLFKRNKERNRESKGFYGTDLWTQVGKAQFNGKLHKGESIYYEIVGYLPNTETMIQKGYRYGCNKGEYKIAVYRITMTNADGVVIEYGWNQMKTRCKELGVPMVEELFYGKVADIVSTKDKDIGAWRVELLNMLKNTYLEKKAEDCDNNPDEGVVVRIDTLNIEAYKYKSELFLLKESKAKDEEVVDIEDEEQAV